MKRVPLTQGKVALVSDKDYSVVRKFKWHAGRRRNMWYAFGKGGRFAMHQLLLPNARRVDHRNLNGLDNRRCNLRPASNGQNMANRGKQRNNTSGRKGVHLCRRTGRWRAGIHVNGKTIHLGRFKKLADAAAVYAENALRYFGEFART